MPSLRWTLVRWTSSSSGVVQVRQHHPGCCREANRDEAFARPSEGRSGGGEPAICEVRPYDGDGIEEVSDVAERVRASLVAHEPEQVLGQLASDLGWHSQVLVLLLSEPGQVVRDVHADAGRVGTVGPAAVVDGAGVEENRAARHLGRFGVRLDEPELVLEPVAPGHDPGCAVLLGEVGERPDRVALHLVAHWEGEEVERPLIAVDRLGGFTGTDGDDLGEVQLDARSVGESCSRSAHDEWIHDHLPGGR